MTSKTKQNKNKYFTVSLSSLRSALSSQKDSGFAEFPLAPSKEGRLFFPNFWDGK